MFVIFATHAGIGQVHAAALVIKAPIRKRDLAATEEKASAQAMPATTPLVAANGSGTPSLSIAITSLQTASPSDKDKDKEVSQTGKDKEKRGEVAISFPCHNAEQLTAILFWQTSKAKVPACLFVLLFELVRACRNCE